MTITVYYFLYEKDCDLKKRGKFQDLRLIMHCTISNNDRTKTTNLKFQSKFFKFLFKISILNIVKRFVKSKCKLLSIIHIFQKAFELYKKKCFTCKYNYFSKKYLFVSRKAIHNKMNMVSVSLYYCYHMIEYA